MKLTDTACRAAKPRDKDFKLYDGNGLYLLVTSRGSKLWRWKYRSHGVERKLSLGSYPEVSIKEAREQVMRERKLLAGGEDPSQAKKIRKLEAAVAAASTFRAIAEEYIAKLEKDGRAPATLIKAKWALNHLSVAIGNRPIREIAPIEIVNVMRGLADEDKLETARRVRAFASRVFRHAIATGRADTDPCHYLRAAVSAPRVKNHAAILDEVEIGALLRAARTYSGQPLTRIAILLSAHLFQRPGEIRQMQWSEIDFEARHWVLPASRMKMRRSHRLPLSAPVLALLREAQEMTGNGRYVFPSMRSHDRPMSENTVTAALRRMGYSGDEMTAHGFRTTASTLLHESGKFSSEAIERSLSHKDANQIRGTYDKSERWEERLKLHEWWSDKLNEWESQVGHKRAA